MGNYAGKGNAIASDQGRQYAVWDNEVVDTGGTNAQATSLAVGIRRTRGIAYPQGFSVELAFSADPGPFECDIIVADTDDLTRYVVKGKITEADLNTSFVGRAEFTATWCRFVALYMASITNPVAVSGLVTL